MKKIIISYILLTGCLTFQSIAQKVKPYSEQYRPQVHYSPQKNWMNDPNGMFYLNGKYHLLYQYSPFTLRPDFEKMHWGHAVSTDLVHWKQLPLSAGLEPDEQGAIFSGSAVVDINNTSGFGKDGKIPVVAIFTHHNMEGERGGRNDFQTQSLAYSLDEGNTWTKYSDNPVVKNPGIRDFRDPKVFWYGDGKKWIMTLATKDRITFLSSPDLKNWTKESEFGASEGEHGGVWECPDLFPMTLKGKTHWVLLVSINPGGPNKGSATQYFIGQFDGKRFVSENKDTRWIDFGPENYAGVTWSGTGKRKIFLGWMNNWSYADKLPTSTWSGASTFPRELNLVNINGQTYIRSEPAKELNLIKLSGPNLRKFTFSGHQDLSKKIGKLPEQYILKLNIGHLKAYKIILSNHQREKIEIGYNQESNTFFIDRIHSGLVGFHQDFPAKLVAPRISTSKSSQLTLLVDVSSIELFADEGTSVLTSTYFPSTPFDTVSLENAEKITISNLSINPLKSIWGSSNNTKRYP